MQIYRPITPTPRTQSKHVAAKTRLCLSFDPGLSPTICGSCGGTLATTGEILFWFLLLEFECLIFQYNYNSPNSPKYATDIQRIR